MGLPMPNTPMQTADRAADWQSLTGRLGGFAGALVGAGREDEADDLVQRTVARLLARRPGEIPDAALARTTLLRLWLDDRRRLRRRAVRLARLAWSRPAWRPGRDGVDEAERLASARAALDALPPVQRAAFVMRVVEDLDYAQIAAALGSTPASVRSSLHLARRRLRLALGETP